MGSRTGLGVGIVGMGVAFPEHVRTNDWWSDEFVESHLKSLDDDIIAGASARAARGEAGVDPAIAKHAAAFGGDPFRGAKERRVLAEGEFSSDLETRAAAAALADAGLSPDDVDLLITFSQVPDYPCPGNHALVAHKLGLRKSVSSMTVGTDCASFIPQLQVASRMVECGEHDTVLIVQGSTSTTVMDWARPASITAGDGAAAAVIRRIPEGFGYVASSIATHGEFHAVVRIAPQNRAEIPWYRGDIHGDHVLFRTMDFDGTRRSTNRVVTLAAESCQSVLQKAGYTTKDVGFFVCTQATAWFGRACCEALEIDPSRTIDTFARYGNLMPANLLVNLHEARGKDLLEDGDLVLGFTPGAGFILGSTLYRWLDPVNARR